MSTGWIKLDRQVCDHWLWKDQPFSYGQAWIDLLLHANHKPAKVLIKNKLIELDRGEQARSEVTLQKHWGWSRGKVRRYLELLKKDKMIVQRAVQVTSIITICNYNSFQHGSTVDGTVVKTVGGTVVEQDSVHKQECKNDKNVKNKELSPSAQVEQEIFNHWKSVMNKNNSTKLNKKRLSAIKARMKEGYSDDDIKMAINGCANTPHNMGQNDRGELFNDLELICRDGSQLERFIGNINRVQAPVFEGDGLLNFSSPAENDFIDMQPAEIGYEPK